MNTNSNLRTFKVGMTLERVFRLESRAIYLVENVPIWGPKVIGRIGILRTAGDELAVGDLAQGQVSRCN
jgi:hypothetical protein